MKNRFAAVLLVAVVLGGCAPTGEPTASPTPTASTAAPSPTPTAAPEPDQSDPANWVIDFDSVGPLQLGQPIAEARAAASAAAYVEGEPVPDCRVAFLARTGSPSLALTYFPDEVLTAIWVRNVGDSGVASEDLAAVSPKTEQGIGVGSSRDDVLAAYPDYTVIREDGDFFAVYAVAGPSGYLMFTLTDGVVDAVAATSSDDFVFEFC